MDIAALSIATSQSNLKGSVGLALMKMTMSTAKQTGENMNGMIKESTNPNLGKILDKRA